jgi:hypothetical protein
LSSSYLADLQDFSNSCRSPQPIPVNAVKVILFDRKATFGLPLEHPDQTKCIIMDESDLVQWSRTLKRIVQGVTMAHGRTELLYRHWPLSTDPHHGTNAPVKAIFLEDVLVHFSGLRDRFGDLTRSILELIYRADIWTAVIHFFQYCTGREIDITNKWQQGRAVWVGKWLKAPEEYMKALEKLMDERDLRNPPFNTEAEMLSALGNSLESEGRYSGH